MSNEKLILDYKILLIDMFMPRLGRHEHEKSIYQEGRPFRGLPDLKYNDYLSLHLPKRDVKLKNH